tara:strand:- start:13531 stop:13758 length:228 start_codon:yes stop_codon:yes gene_type:complete
MRKKKEKYKVNRLEEFDIEEFRDVIKNLEKLLTEKVITEDNVKTLTNTIGQLTLLRDKHVDALISWLKQDYILDD